MRFFSYLILLIIMLIGLTFASLNSVPVVFNYYLGTKTLALSLLLVLAFGCGIFLGFFVTIFPWLKLKRDNRKLRSRLKLAEKEIENLRTLPIKDG
jgi:lipopolysaccharide assembly protein A